MTLFAALLLHPAFRTFLTGAGFFSDSYDLFITDGVTNMLKDLGPVQRVSYSYQPVGQPYPTNLTSYFSAYCVDGVRCLPKLYNSATGTWDPNPSTTFTPEFTPHYQLQTPALKNAVSNAALIGSITGQLVFGFAGDVLGRKWCFVLTTLLIIVGCLGSATAAAGVRVAGRLNAAGAWGDTSAQPAGFTQDVYAQLVFWRAILGFGVGGEYPLAGTIASEGAKDTASRGRSVLYTFSMQGWGKLTASLVNYFLVSNLRFFGGAWTLDGAWRFALGLGCTLNLLTVPFRWYMEESHIFSKSSVVASSQAASVKQGEEEGGEEGGDRPTVVAGGASSALATLALPTAPSTAEVGKASKLTLALLWEHRWTLVGTAGCWFLIDVTFYGQSLMNTTVVSEAVASTIGLNAMQKLRSSLLSTVWIMLIAIPGYWIAIFTVDWLGRKPLQRLGFLATAAVFLVLGLAYNTPLRTTASGGGFVFLYGLTYLFSNAGPNSVTFLMPAEAFPTLVRSTAHGISAAFGKVGATVGAYGLLELLYAYPLVAGNPSPDGVVAVMLVCAAVALLGAAVNEYFCKETGKLSLEEVDSGGKKGGAGAGAGTGADAGAGAAGNNLCVRVSRAWEGGEGSSVKTEDSDSTPLTAAGHQPGGRAQYGSIPWPEPQ